MRILCAIAGRRGVELIDQLVGYLGTQNQILLLAVIDVGPRHEMGRVGGPLRHAPLGGPEREHELNASEESGARAALDEALQAARKAGLLVEAWLRRGRPEQVIVEVAAEAEVALIVIQAREAPQAHPRQGPPSVGHTARFVVDHAPCPVLLLRERVQKPY